MKHGGSRSNPDDVPGRHKSGGGLAGGCGSALSDAARTPPAPRAPAPAPARPPAPGTTRLSPPRLSLRRLLTVMQPRVQALFCFQEIYL